jgi:hypothetical protein
MTPEDIKFCENRFVDLNVSRFDAWQVGEALGYLYDRGFYGYLSCEPLLKQLSRGWASTVVTKGTK